MAASSLVLQIISIVILNCLTRLCFVKLSQ